MLDEMPVLAGCVTLAVGFALVAAPRSITGPLGLGGQNTAVLLAGAAEGRSRRDGRPHRGDGATALALRPD
jgi:hypothetical protein